MEEDQFGFRKCKGGRDTIRLMRIISERVLDVKRRDVSSLHKLGKGSQPC